MSTSLQSSEIIKRAHAIGTYYGFTPLSELVGDRKRVVAPKDKKAQPAETFTDTDSISTEVYSLLKRLRDADITPGPLRPLFVWHTNAAPGRPAPRTITIQFHALGVSRAIADAVLIRAVHSLVTDLTKTDPQLHINSMGDKETRSRFARELGLFFRKHGALLPAESMTCAKRDVLEAAEMLAELEEHKGSLPSPIDHLSEASRKHFENVLEYLEETDTPYTLTPTLLSRATSWTETCFEIQGGDNVYAWGARYNEFTKHVFKSAIPSMGAVIRINTSEREVIPAIKEKNHPRFVFVHIGDEAKRESMKITDALRHAKLPVRQILGVESLTEQMRLADEFNPPYLLIMGRKEALEHSVILRERSNYSERSILLSNLVSELKEVA